MAESTLRCRARGSSFEGCFKISEIARGAVRAGQRERAGQDIESTNGSAAAGRARAGTGRPRPASAVRKTVAARTLAALVVAASRDALGRHMSGALMRRWSTWDLRGSQRPNSPRGIAAPVFLLRCASLPVDEARLRRTWPAPDGRGRPAPARRGRAACHSSRCSRSAREHGQQFAQASVSGRDSIG